MINASGINCTSGEQLGTMGRSFEEADFREEKSFYEIVI